MHHFRFVSRKETSNARNQIEKLIHDVQKRARDEFKLTFSYEYVGSYKLGIVTVDPTTNKGYDFDINIRINDKNNNLKAKYIKNILMNCFNQAIKANRNYELSPCQDNKRVFTIKVIDNKNSRI